MGHPYRLALCCQILPKHLQALCGLPSQALPGSGLLSPLLPALVTLDEATVVSQLNFWYGLTTSSTGPCALRTNGPRPGYKLTPGPVCSSALSPLYVCHVHVFICMCVCSHACIFMWRTGANCLAQHPFLSSYILSCVTLDSSPPCGFFYKTNPRTLGISDALMRILLKHRGEEDVSRER